MLQPWAQPTPGTGPGASHGKRDPVDHLCLLSCRDGRHRAGRCSWLILCQPASCPLLSPRVHMDLHGFIMPSAGVGTGMVSLRFLSLGNGFLHSLCCFPFIPKACGPRLDFPQAMAGRSSLGTARCCPSVPVQQFWQVLPEEVTPAAPVSPPAPSGQSRSWRERLQKVPFLCPRGFIISCRGMATESPALF